ncbi:MAG: hypothetical protein NC320_07865 [Clostridium sp.]|nr:hypothetical protein [Clostridium sp.]
MISGAVKAFAGVAGIKKAFGFVEDCTQAFNTQLNAETQLISVLSNMLDADYVAQFELETTADTTRAVNEINAIQNGIDEVVVPVSAESKALVAAFDQITEKASEIQSRGIYGDEAMIAAAAEFSTYFSDINAIEMMMDTLSDYAMGMSGGGEVGSQQMVDYATNLGKIMTGAYDAMTKKGFELTDTQKAIIEGTATQEQIVAALGEEYANMSSDMQAAAAISQFIEEPWAGLYESMSNTPEGKIIQMTNAWGDMKEVVGGQLYPYVLLFVDAITENWSTIEAVVQGITTGLEFLLGVLSWVLEAAISVAGAVADNWSWLSPIIYGVAAALAVYYGWQLAVNTVELIGKGIKIAMCVASYAHAAATGAEASANAVATAAQYGLNTAILACPLTWIIVAIIALCSALAIYVNQTNKAYGTTFSFAGMLGGAVLTVLATLGNMVMSVGDIIGSCVVFVWNIVADLSNFLANVFVDPLGAVVRLFVGVFDTILGLIEGCAEAIGNLFGLDWGSGIQGFRDKMNAAVEAEFGAGDYELMPKLDADALSVKSLFGIDYMNYDDVFDTGYYLGEQVGDKIDEIFDPSSLFGTTDVPSPEDYANNFTGIDDIGSGVDNIAGNTSDIADSMDITEEDLKYLRDIAEQETINRFTTAEIKIEQTNNNTISSDWDLDGVVDGLTDAVDEAVNIISEGVHV